MSKIPADVRQYLFPINVLYHSVANENTRCLQGPRVYLYFRNVKTPWIREPLFGDLNEWFAVNMLRNFSPTVYNSIPNVASGNDGIELTGCHIDAMRTLVRWMQRSYVAGYILPAHQSWSFGHIALMLYTTEGLIATDLVRKLYERAHSLAAEKRLLSREDLRLIRNYVPSEHVVHQIPMNNLARGYVLSEQTKNKTRLDELKAYAKSQGGDYEKRFDQACVEHRGIANASLGQIQQSYGPTRVMGPRVEQMADDTIGTEARMGTMLTLPSDLESRATRRNEPAESLMSLCSPRAVVGARD